MLKLNNQLSFCLSSHASLFELGYFITTNDKIIYVFNDIGEVFEISNYTKNYLIYRYSLNKKDVDELERIMHKYNIKVEILLMKDLIKKYRIYCIIAVY